MTAIVAHPPVLPTTNPDDFIRFPPWPSPPPGVTIIPFKDYVASKKEAGIKLTCPNPDRIEVDGFDIPTVALGHPHTTDKCKTDALRDDNEGDDIIKPKKRKIKTSVITGDVKYEWWQIWADEEAGKFIAPYNRKTPAIDRLCQAATDFRASRTWPQGEPRQLSPTKLFNQFGVFIGLQAIIPTWIRAERRKKEEALNQFKDSIEQSGHNGTQEEDIDDDDDSEQLLDTSDDVTVPPSAQAAVEQQTENDRPVDPKLKNQDEIEAAAIQEENERKDDRLLAFLEDPETTIKMFLSSYMRKEGLVWSDPNLTNTPRVIFFFIRYMLRNKLLPEYEAGLKKALAIVERAQIELPRTSVVAKIIPCEVSLALRDQYGSKAAQFKLITDDATKVEELLQNGSIDLDADGQWPDDDGDNAIVDADCDPPALEEPTVEYVGDGEYVDAEQPIDQDEGIAEVEEVDDETGNVTQTAENGWNDNGWGDVATDVESSADNGWGNATGGGVWSDNPANWNDTSTFAFTDGESSPTINWTSPTYNLQNFLGIDALPESYTTGVVEESVRKVISVHGPGTDPVIMDGTGAASEARLGRIVLAPWNDWDIPKESKGLNELRRVYSEIYRGRRIEKGIRRFGLDKDGEEGAGEDDDKTFKPEELYEEEEHRQEYSESTNAKIVWGTSMGWVVDPDSLADEGDVLYSNCTDEKPAVGEVMSEENKKVLGVHDPTQDTIEVLVDPAVIENLKDVVGLGLGGTFVQLVHDGKEETTRKYWYADKLSLVIPSFYIA